MTLAPATQLAEVGRLREASLIYRRLGPATDWQWSWSATRARSAAPRVLPGMQAPVVGAFSVGGDDGVLWYEPSLPTDVIWYR